MKWKKYIIRFNPEKKNIEGIYSSSKDIPNEDPKTIASRARSKNKTPDDEGFVYYRWEDFEELYPDLLHSHLLTLPEPPPFYIHPPLNLVLTIGGKIISVNDLYKARLVYVGGKPKPAIYKNPKAKEVASEIYRQLQSVDISPWIPWLEKTKAFKISINFVVKSGITRRDTENLGKNIIDTVVRYIRGYSGITHFDDSEFLEVYFTKSIIPKAKHEYALISLEESNHNPRFDYIPEPTRFYLGGLLGEKWKDEIIQVLEESGKTWYSPELNLWNGEEWGIEENKKCNTYLEIFDIGERGEEEFCQVRDKILHFNSTRPYDKFLYIGFTGVDLGESWITKEITRLRRIECPGLVVKYITSPKELLMKEVI